MLYRGRSARERIIHYLGLVLAFISLCSGVAGMVAILAQDYAIILVGHLVAAISGGWAGYLADRRRLGSRFFPWIMAFTLPLFGGCAAYFLLETMKKPRAGRLFDEYAAYLNDAASYKDSVPVMDHATLSEATQLGDILANPASNAEQRIAIEYLSEMETQSAFELLRGAAGTTGSEAYFFAMTAMTHAEEKMLSRLSEIEDTINTGDPERVDVELLIKAASCYYDFIYYQFAGGARRNEYLEKAAAYLRRALEIPDIPARELNEALFLLGKVLLALNDNESAAHSFTQYIGRNPQSQAARFWRAEAWYKMGDYLRLREDLSKAASMGDIPINMRSSMELWIGWSQNNTKSEKSGVGPAMQQSAKAGAPA